MRQLIFTSAPRGVDLGRSGFCTVARHGSLRERLCRELEKLSTYEALKDRSPTVYRHRLLSAGGETVHVLTRFTGGGRDYSGRTSYLAHHLILEPAEAAAAPAPAELFLRWEGWLDKWEGGPRTLGPNDNTPLPSHEPAPLPATEWQRATGDAGRAALLVSGPGWRVVCPPREEARLIQLFREASALIPSGAAWDITFSTGLLGGDTPKDFHWIGGPSDAPAFADAMRFQHLRTLAIGAPDQLPPPHGIATQLARLGMPLARASDLL
jgi:hypothetical protein